MSNYTDTTYDLHASDLAAEVVGKSVVEIRNDEDTPGSGQLVLSDGAILTFYDTEDCCAYFYTPGPEARVGDIRDNIITNVISRNDELPADAYSAPEAFTLVLLAEATEIAAIPITGDSTSGYYVHSIAMTITRPTKEAC